MGVLKAKIIVSHRNIHNYVSIEMKILRRHASGEELFANKK